MGPWLPPIVRRKLGDLSKMYFLWIGHSRWKWAQMRNPGKLASRTDMSVFGARNLSDTLLIPPTHSLALCSQICRIGNQHCAGMSTPNLYAGVEGVEISSPGLLDLFRILLASSQPGIKCLKWKTLAIKWKSNQKTNHKLLLLLSLFCKILTMMRWRMGESILFMRLLRQMFQSAFQTKWTNMHGKVSFHMSLIDQWRIRQVSKGRLPRIEILSWRKQLHIFVDWKLSSKHLLNLVSILCRWWR